jgi:autotransporter-associated beta strand protein
VLRLTNFYIDLNATQKGLLVLSGGTLAARATNTNFLGTTSAMVGDNNDRWLTNINVFVREGGAIFDTRGYSVGVKQPLLSGAPADGGLIKRGAGRLILFNTNTFNGAMSVEAGTLELGRHDALPAASTVSVSSNAVVDAGGKTQVLAGIAGSGTVANPGGLSVAGTVAPGDAGSFGTLTFAAAPAALAGTLSVNVSTNGACDRLHVEGNLDLTALSLSVEDAGQLAKYTRYVVASCTGTLGAPFAAAAPLPARWLLKYNAAAKQAYLVYDSGTMIMVR